MHQLGASPVARQEGTERQLCREPTAQLRALPLGHGSHPCIWAVGAPSAILDRFPLRQGAGPVPTTSFSGVSRGCQLRRLRKGTDLR